MFWDALITNVQLELKIIRYVDESEDTRRNAFVAHIYIDRETYTARSLFTTRVAMDKVSNV